jgi:hypothetical protein
LMEAGWREHREAVLWRAVQNFSINYDLLKGNRLGTGILLSASACGLRSKIQRQLLIVDTLQRRWSLEGIVQPSHQVAVDE